MRGKRLSIGLRAVLAIFAATLFVTSALATAQETVLHSFNNTDGANPYAGLIFDAAGNLYGTTYLGGTGSCLYGGSGCGTVFELSPNGSGGWTEQVLHYFSHNGTDGIEPFGGLIIDAAGNLYGTTQEGGTHSGGTVFELSPGAGGTWTEQVLHNFSGTDGNYPGAGLIFDAAGNLYGTTYTGGTYSIGTVFELSPQAGGGWTETVLHNFDATGTDGAFPEAGLIFDAAGNLYGTTFEGGTYGSGTVFELTPGMGGTWTEQVLWSFNDNGTDGTNPLAGLTIDAAGNLYGTTEQGGSYGWGTVFELTPGAGGVWTEQVLHAFNNNGTDGLAPVGGLIFDGVRN